MLFLTLDNRLVNMNLKGSLKQKSKSALQETVKKQLVSFFPLDKIIEEWKIPGAKLFVDFFLPQRKAVIEVQSSIHDKHTDFFHGKDKHLQDKFLKQKKRDINKKIFCEKNDITLYEIYSEDEILETLENIKRESSCG